MKRICPVLLSAALLLGLAACGSQSTSASSVPAPSSSVETSSSAPSEMENSAAQTVQPLAVFSITDPMEDGIYSAGFELSDLEDTEGGYVLNASLYAYDQYDMVDIATLKPGDTLLVHDFNGEWVEKTIETVETNDYGVTINGGMDFENGLDLAEEDTCYRTLFWDDYPIYYEQGKALLYLADDVVLNDSSAEPGAEPVVTAGAEAVAEAVASSDPYWVCTNTTLRIENGVVVEINRRWVP